MSDDLVWIPSVPLPLQGWRTVRCRCGRKFRGRDRNWNYEIHYRREHQTGDINPDAMMGVSRYMAHCIYAAVNEGRAQVAPEQEET